MKYENGKVSGIKLAYIGGGSRGWAWKFMTDLAIEDAMSGEVALYDIDEAAAKAIKSRISKRIRGRVRQQQSCFPLPDSAIRRRLISDGGFQPTTETCLLLPPNALRI